MVNNEKCISELRFNMKVTDQTFIFSSNFMKPITIERLTGSLRNREWAIQVNPRLVLFTQSDTD